MDWLIDHIQLVIAVAAAFAYWLNARKQQQPEEDDEPNVRQLRDESQEAAEEAERARRIREEIRRKIAERVGGDVTAPRPVAGPPPVIRQLEVNPPRLDPEPPRQPMIDSALLEQQRRLQEQLEEAVRAKQRAQEIRREVPTKRRTASTAVPALAGRGIRADLQNRESLRRAVVLREVLGPPVGLR